MFGEQMQRILNRMWRSYASALRFYAEHKQGQRESIEAIAKDASNPTSHERAMGQIRWADTATAKGLVDDWTVEERRVAINAQVATVDLLTTIHAQLEEMNQKLNQLVLRGVVEGGSRTRTIDPDSLLD